MSSLKRVSQLIPVLCGRDASGVGEQQARPIKTTRAHPRTRCSWWIAEASTGLLKSRCMKIRRAMYVGVASVGAVLALGGLQVNW